MKMLAYIAVIGSLLIAPTYAQQQQLQDKDYALTVSLSDLNTISDGLMNEPYSKAFPLINKLRQQVIAQQAKPEGVPTEKPQQIPENK